MSVVSIITQDKFNELWNAGLYPFRLECSGEVVYSYLKDDEGNWVGTKGKPNDPDYFKIINP